MPSLTALPSLSAALMSPLNVLEELRKKSARMPLSPNTDPGVVASSPES